MDLLPSCKETQNDYNLCVGSRLGFFYFSSLLVFLSVHSDLYLTCTGGLMHACYLSHR